MMKVIDSFNADDFTWRTNNFEKPFQLFKKLKLRF